jgi:hypothetical protein
MNLSFSYSEIQEIMNPQILNPSVLEHLVQYLDFFTLAAFQCAHRSFADVCPHSMRHVLTTFRRIYKDTPLRIGRKKTFVRDRVILTLITLYEQGYTNFIPIILPCFSISTQGLTSFVSRFDLPCRYYELVQCMFGSSVLGGGNNVNNENDVNDVNGGDKKCTLAIVKRIKSLKCDESVEKHLLLHTNGKVKSSKAKVVYCDYCLSVRCGV